jgi:isopenicillin-N epimerase
VKEHWLLDPDVIFLNHGSFGATPRVVLEAQNAFRQRMEEEPVSFLVRELEPLLDATRTELGKFVGASPADLAFVPNATTAVNAVLRSLELRFDDELLVTSHEYNASRNTLDHVAARAGAKIVIVHIPFPIGGPDDVVERISGATTDRTRLLLVDHVTSQTALVFPIERIVREMDSRGIDTLVDGAHAPGMLPLDLRSLGAAYYAANLHKWVCAPKGAGLLYVRDDRRSTVHPAITSHGANASRTDRSRFHLEFDWTGTFDPTPWLAVSSALRFIPSLVPGGWAEVMRRNHELALRGRDTLCHALSIDRPAPDMMLGSMAAVPLPDGSADTAPSLYGDPLQDVLFERFAIEVPVVPWPGPPKRVLRISAQLYNQAEEYEVLANALRTLL